MPSKKTKEQVQGVANERGFAFDDDAYMGSQVLHHWRCVKAQHRFLSKYNAIQQGSGCPECWKTQLALPRPDAKHPTEKRTYLDEEIETMVRLFQDGKSYRIIAEETGFNFSAIVYHVRKRLGEGAKRRMGRKKKYHGLSKIEVRKHHNLRKFYKISFEQYSEMLRVQNGVCDICGKPPMQTGKPTSVLGVDHDHETGAVRSLLCGNCNSALGHLQDDPELCEKAAAYLRRHGKGSKKAA